MEAVRQHTPVILVLGTGAADKIDSWLERSPYSAREAASPFEALEQISDFTVRTRPDVIYMHVESVDKELTFMRSIVTTTDAAEIAILGFGTEAGWADDSLNALGDRLFQLIPTQNLV